MESSWPTTTPGARVQSAPDRVPVRDALSPGTRLDEFEIVRVLGTGGFGIVYLARDHVLQRDVAVKEYMPTALAGRGEGATVSLRSGGFADLFAKGLESFLSEARLLASFDHRSLVKVHRFWRGNATAYMAMQHYPGRTLKDARRDMTVPPDEAWLDAFVDAILGVLELLHGEGVYHRDISPDNILLLDDGSPVLLDLGSARRVMAGSPQSFTAHLKPQFAPIEQYAEEAGGMPQGPWTDLYALGATLYFVVTGRAPTPSVVRAVRDTLSPLVAPAGPTIPSVRAPLLATIDWTLALAPEQRPQNVRSVRRALSGEIAPPPPSPRQLGAATVVAPAPSPRDEASAECASVAAPSRRWFSRLTATFWSAEDTPDSNAPHSRRRTRASAALSLALLGIVALGGGAWTFDRPSPHRPAPPASPQDLAPAAITRVATAPRSMTPASPPPATTSLPATVPAPAPLTAIETTPSPAPASSPVRPVALSNADPVAHWLQPPPARDRHRAARAKVQTANAASRATHPSRSKCDASGMLGRAWCALNPCKAAPRGRANPECIERLRAEASRQQRIERQ